MSEQGATEWRESPLPDDPGDAKAGPGEQATPEGDVEDAAAAWEGYSLETLTSLLDS
jgi:hypothetical protein